MSETFLEVNKREAAGKNANRRLRATGQIPAVVYGGGLDPAAIQVSQRRVEEILRSGSGSNTVFQLELEGSDSKRHAMIRDLQVDAITGQMIHIDFQRILLDQAVHVQVGIHLVGEPVGVKTEGGLVDFVTRELDIDCLPNQIPDRIDLDISDLHIGQHLEAGDIELPEGVALHGDAERVIVSVAQRQKEEVEEVEEDEMLLEAEAEQPERIGGAKSEDED